MLHPEDAPALFKPLQPKTLESQLIAAKGQIYKLGLTAAGRQPTPQSSNDNQQLGGGAAAATAQNQGARR